MFLYWLSPRRSAAQASEVVRAAWRRFLWHQFHDDLTGTSINAAYRISWHDEALASAGRDTPPARIITASASPRPGFHGVTGSPWCSWMKLAHSRPT